MNAWLTAVPAYGKDYETEEEVQKAWEAGKDFVIQDISCRWDGKPINKQDAVRIGYPDGLRKMKLRYNKLADIAVIEVSPS